VDGRSKRRNQAKGAFQITHRILRFTALAEADLDDIWFYIAADNIPAADRLIDALHAAATRLLAHPRSGVSRTDLAPNLRALIHGRYILYYVPEAIELVIVRVLHGARDSAAIAEQGGFAHE